MNRSVASLIIALALFTALGCTDQKTAPPPVAQNTKIKAEMDKLSPEDRALAEAQRVCPVTDEPLGSMGTPIKVVIKDKPVFLCCKSCEAKAKASPDAMLEKVEELKARVGSNRG
jgi:hypothetical protein